MPSTQEARMTVLELPAQLAAPPAALDAVALFIDVDGTLLEFRDTPQAVFAPVSVLRLLEALTDWCDGALALVSGRTVADLDRIFHPLRLPAAGVHGAERRSRPGEAAPTVDAGPDPAYVAARTALSRFASAHAGALVEDKGVALALHTRRAPSAYSAAADLVHAIAESSSGRWRPVLGRFVAELRPADADKGRAIAAFMADPPFAGRRPLALGDDTTDADAFDEVLARGGITVAVGPHGPAASFRLESPRDCRRWLASLCGHADGPLR
jgi:trehalose 6-phosphate phosphatase